jgi:hypothetical protein
VSLAYQFMELRSKTGKVIDGTNKVCSSANAHSWCVHLHAHVAMQMHMLDLLHGPAEDQDRGHSWSWFRAVPASPVTRYTYACDTMCDLCLTYALHWAWLFAAKQFGRAKCLWDPRCCMHVSASPHHCGVDNSL